ncbi:probable disease resistance protein At4g27220 [Rhodamnia argentea]|uniref:Probable disease resistance protein At4g27220 n=1 Tax=Rhodamnia argentea TaxID=178133 RepID=A0ABM3HJ87_9MYRT|nr:probable disease resistance protein At4g27220 [Rhodamnia argentea]
MAGSFFTSVAVNLVSKIGGYLFAPIGRQFGYVLCYKSYVEDLQTAVEELEGARESVQQSVDQARRNVNPIRPYVEDWLGKAMKEAEEAQQMLERGKTAKNACFRGWIPNPLVRHRIGRQVREATEFIRVLREKARNSDFKKVYDENIPPGIVIGPPIPVTRDALESRALIADDVTKALADDKVHVIGVHGVGGVGKSKLLADIKNRVKGEKLFDEVAMVDVSRDPDLKRIQGEIADSLGPNLMNMETTRGRAELLNQRLTGLKGCPKKKILILLDNLWEKLELEKVGIPCGDDNKVRGCKLLLTSRRRDVLRDDMCSDRLFELKVLKYGEARRLFESRVGNRVDDPDFAPFVEGVVRNCKGLPLWIVLLAKTLKHRDLTAWRSAWTNIGGSVEKSIELNYNELKDKRIKSVFLVCSLHSGRISLRDCLVYCMGLGLYDELCKTIENARDQLSTDLHSLKDSSLLQDNDDKKWFRMHDVIVDEAISIASKEWDALVGREGEAFKKWSKDELRKCTAMSLRRVGIAELPEKLDCPNLNILLLTEHNPSLKIPPSFFESMKKLQVLDITGLSFTSLPSSIELLENLKSLSLDDCHLEDVTALGKLKGLHSLSFSNSTIARLPKGIDRLTELRFLDLRGCKGLKVIEPGVLGSLVNLEELYIDSFDQWQAEDDALRSNATLAELKNMKKLKTLYITIPHSTTLSSDLPFGNLNEYKIQIGGTEGWWGRYEVSRTLKIKLDSGNLLREVCMQECLGRTQDLCLDGLQDGGDSIHNLCTEGFHELKHLHVKDNRSFQYVVDSTNCLAFTKLESLVLENLNKLEKICHDCLEASEDVEILSRLTTVLKVHNCEKLRFLFSSSMAKTLLQIKVIEIVNCELLEEIIDVEEESEEVASIDTSEFSQLTSLSLEELPNLRTFAYGMYHIYCPILTRLRISGCPKMTTFSSFKGKQQSIAVDTDLQQPFGGVNSSLSLPILFDRKVLFPSLEELTLVSCGLMKIWPNELSEKSFCKLASITVRDCENLSHIFPSTLIERFQSLKMIEVVKCTSLEALMEHVPVNSKERQKHLVSLKLKEVKLWDLPRLNALVPSSTKAMLGLSSLTNVSLRCCHSLRFLFTNDTSRTLDKLEKLEVSGCNNMQEVIAREESGERKLKPVKFSHLRTLELCSLKSLISFCSGSCAYEFPSLRKLSILECTEVKAFILRMSAPRVETMNRGSAGFDESPHSLFDEKVVFPILEKLRLTGIQSRQLWENEMPNESICRLKVLEVKQCPNLLNVIPAFMWKRPLHCMESLTVEECPRLRNLLTISMAKSLVQLQHLILGGCGEMECIIAREEEKPEEAIDIIEIPQLVTLHLHKMIKLRSFCHGKHISKWPSLENFIVEDCNAVEVIIGDAGCRRLEGSVPTQQPLLLVKKVIPQLEILRLAREDVVMIPQHYIFRNLRGLGLGCYHDENVAFPSDFLLRRFPNLEGLGVGCSSFEEIFPEDKFGCGGATLSGSLTDMERPLKALGNLKQLQLYKLYNLSRLWKDGSLMAEILKQIETLWVWNCPNLSIVFPSPTPFERLKQLKVEDCAGLVHIGTSSAVTSPVHLTRLILRNCGTMEDVVTTDHGNGAEDISFPKLQELILDCLPSLESFSPTNCAFGFPSLVRVVVTQCPKMNIFCKGALRTPQLDKVVLSDGDDEWRWEGDLNTTIQTLSM